MRPVANVIGVARSNLAARAKRPERKLVGRRPQPDEDLVGEIKGVIADLPTYGYRRVHAILRRRAAAEGRQPPNHKRVYAVMKRHGLLLERHAGGTERRHDGRIAVAEPNLRWCRHRRSRGSWSRTGPSTAGWQRSTTPPSLMRCSSWSGI